MISFHIWGVRPAGLWIELWGLGYLRDVEIIFQLSQSKLLEKLISKISGVSFFFSPRGT